MKEPIWVKRRVLLYLHLASLAEFGGGQGIRDENLLDSALAQPQQRFHYDANCDLASLAAASCFGLAKNHPFVAGNKRAAFHALVLFLDNTGHGLRAGTVECVQVVLGVASGKITEQELAVWIRQNLENVELNLP